MNNLKFKSNIKNQNKKITYLVYSLLFLCFFSLIFFIYASQFIIPQLILSTYLNANATILISLLFPLIAFSYLLSKTNDFDFVIKNLGLSIDKLTFKNIIFGILLFLIILIGVEFGLSSFSKITNISLPTHVQQLLQGFPLYFYLFTFLIAPINEEILFRGFLVPRIGIILSAVIFASLHFSYLSISEFAAALIFGLIAGYAFKRTKSLYVSIVAHMLLNFLTILILFLI